MEHGGIVLDYSLNEKLIDFSSNINPLGYPRSVDRAILGNLEKLKVYPDFRHRRVLSNVSSYLNVPSNFVSVGNGSMELLDLIISNFEEVVLFEPCFSEYEIRAGIQGKKVQKHRLDEGRRPDPEKLILGKKTLLILGNPNNPTGCRISSDLLAQIYEKVIFSGAHLLLDEAFFEFCPEDYDSVQLFYSDGYRHVSILRAATKFFGLPGLRFGYAAASEEMTDFIRERQLSWTLNAFVAPVSEVIFRDADFIERSKRYMEEERFFLKKSYEHLSAFDYCETHANFYLLKCLKYSAEEVFQFLLSAGILARNTSNFEGLDGEFLRFAIRTHEENILLLDQLKKMSEE